MNYTKLTKKEERNNKIIELYKSGLKIIEIANILKIDRRTVTSVLKKEKGITYKSTKNKLSLKTIERNNKVIDLYLNENKSIHEISNILNLDRRTISKILKDNNIEIKILNDHSKKSRKHFFDINIFKQIDTEEKAYWLGFLYADGNVSSDMHTVAIQLQESDYDHLIKFRNFLQGNDIQIELHEKNKACRIRINSTVLSHDLQNLGCIPRKSLALKFPTLEQVPKYLIHHFLRGYFDGDGCICISNKQAHFTIVGTPEFLNGYEHYILKALGRQKPNKRKKAKVDHDRTEFIAYAGNKQCEKIYYYLYKDATIFLDRKYEKFNSILPSQNEADNNSEMISAELSEKAVTSEMAGNSSPKANGNISQAQRIDSDPLTTD